MSAVEGFGIHQRSIRQSPHLHILSITHSTHFPPHAESPPSSPPSTVTAMVRFSPALLLRMSPVALFLHSLFPPQLSLPTFLGGDPERIYSSLPKAPIMRNIGVRVVCSRMHSFFLLYKHEQSTTMLPALVFLSLLLLSRRFRGAQAAVLPTPLSWSTVIAAGNFSTAASLFSSEGSAPPPFPLLSSSPLPLHNQVFPTDPPLTNPAVPTRPTTSLALSVTAPVDIYRVPNTHTVLHIGLLDEPIPKPNLGRTILRTQQTVAAFIRDHDAEDRPLVRFLPSSRTPIRCPDIPFSSRK